MTLYWVLAVTVLAGSLTACGGGSGTSSATQGDSSPVASAAPLQAAPAPNLAALSGAQQLWQAAAVHSYSFSYKEGGGYKFAVYPYKKIQVVDGAVVAVDGDSQLAQEPQYQRLSVEGLYKFIQEAYAAKDAPTSDVSVTYDALLGFPLEIQTHSNACCDQDYTLAIKDFQIDP